MTRLVIGLRDGGQREIDADPGKSLMLASREQGIEDFPALCGGNASCLTCHVYFDPQTFALLNPLPQDESDLLDSLVHRKATSRLACQIPVSTVPEGTRVQIAPEE